MTTSYFLSRDVGGAHHRQRHGAPGARSCSRRCTTTPARAADFLKLPNNAVVELGSKIEI